MTNSSNSKNNLFFPDETSLPEENSIPKKEEETLKTATKAGDNSQQKKEKKDEDNKIWLSISEAAKMGGVQNKTIRRAIKADKDLKYKIVNNKYRIEIQSLIDFMYTNRKLQNKFNQKGLGQYVKKWKIKT